MEQEVIVFGGGCFWCTEAVFLMIKGVQSVEPGYAGPARSGRAPTYEEVSTGTTPYVESTKIVYNPDFIAFPELLQIFFSSHDPTTPNRQGNDVGPQYRSAIFYTTERQKQMAEHYIKMLSGGVRPIVTTVEPLIQFYKAEEYHQKYYENHKDVGYCQLVIAPKVEKISSKFKDLLRHDS